LAREGGVVRGAVAIVMVILGHVRVIIGVARLALSFSILARSELRVTKACWARMAELGRMAEVGALNTALRRANA
jgi:hypothetical protein